MVFQVYDSLRKEKRPFEPLQHGVVRMYNCGPTVYGRAHIGNLRTFLFADTLRRWLECSGFEVRQVMNITDVGHLLDDADEGEDKIEAQARREKRDPFEISRGFTRLFVEDMTALGCREPAVRPKASEHIPEMLEIIEGLIARGYAYEVKGDVYFEVGKFPRYGRLSGNSVAELEAGARIEVREEKRHPADFALWKSDPKHLMKWASRFGPDGFPGWHIECSAMARKHLGDVFDIHTGGEDNVFPHHECEIAQSEALLGDGSFARYWMHSKFLQVDGGKMSKRLGNVWNLDDVKARGFTPRELRFALIRGHYGGPLNFTWGILEEARSALEKLDELCAEVLAVLRGERVAQHEQAMDQVRISRATFDRAMDDDLNVPQALSTLFNLRAAILEFGCGPETAKEALAFLQRAHAALGVLKLEEATLDARLDTLLADYKAARARKDYASSDKLRAEFTSLGFVIQDTPQGTVWRKKG